MDFVGLLGLMGIIFIVHEWGHYLAYRLFGIPVYFKLSVFVPQVLPRQTIRLRRSKGLVIALAGFVISTLLIVVPSVFFYKLWKALLIGSIAGASVDFLWAASMVFSKTVLIKSKYQLLAARSVGILKGAIILTAGKRKTYPLD